MHAPFLLPNNFRYQMFFETQRGSAARFYGTVGQKVSTENLDTPPRVQTFSLPQFNATVNDSPTEMFGIVRQKISTENLDTLPPPLIHKLFRYRKLLQQ